MLVPRAPSLGFYATRMDSKPGPQSSTEFRKYTSSLHPLPDFQVPHPLANPSHKATPAPPLPATTPFPIATSSQTHHSKRPDWECLETYMGCGRGAQVGSPSAPKALESQRHQSSMTSPLPEHHSELMVASCKSWERGGRGQQQSGDLPSHCYSRQCSSIPQWVQYSLSTLESRVSQRAKAAMA